MTSEWVTSSLLDHYDVRSGLSKPAKDFGSGYPFLTFKDVFYHYFTPELLGDFVQSTQKEREGCSVLRGDVFLTRTSETMHELGMSCVALRDYKDATFNGFCKRLRPKPDSDLLPEYVGYYLRSPKFRQSMLALSTMSTRASLNNEMIGRLEISFPSRNAQTWISGILKSLDDRITLLRETNATLEAIAQALFKSWFVDFDPVRAKMEGRAPEGMDETTAKLFPDGLEASELGAVPAGWSVGQLQDLLLLQRGFDLPSQERQPGAFPIIAASGPSGSHFVHMAKGPGVITGRSGVLGRVFLELGDYWPLNTTLWVKEFRAATPCYAYEVLRLLDFKSFNAGSAVPTLNRNHIHSLRYLIPSRACVEAYEQLALQLQLKVRANSEQAQTLISLRDMLLPRLISGQWRLPDVETEIEVIAA